MTSAYSQLILLGAISFCTCGMVNSINSLAGGIANQVVAGEITLIQSVVFIITSFFAPILATYIGSRNSISYSCTTCLLYILSIRSYKMDNERSPVICMICAALSGCGLSIFWVAHSTLIMAYPSAGEHGRYIALFWAIYYSGAMLGSLLTFVTNIGNKSHVPSAMTFIAFSIVASLGIMLSRALSPLENVYRSDGITVSSTLPTHSKQFRYASYELRLLIAMLMFDGRLHGLLLLFLYSNWFYAYCFGSFNFAVFNARSSGWNNFVYFFAQLLATRYVGKYLDDSSSTNKHKATHSLLLLAGISVSSWFLAYAIELAAPEIRSTPLDLITFAREHLLLPLIIFINFAAWGFCDSYLQIWCYWILSELYHGPDFSRAVGVYKAVQACGALCTWLCTLCSVPSVIMLHSNWVLVLMALSPALRVCRALPEDATDHREEEPGELARFAEEHAKVASQYGTTS